MPWYSYTYSDDFESEKDRLIAVEEFNCLFNEFLASRKRERIRKKQEQEDRNKYPLFFIKEGIV